MKKVIVLSNTAGRNFKQQVKSTAIREYWIRSNIIVDLP